MTPEEIKEIRTHFRMTQHEFAMLLGVHPGTIARWETSRAFPSKLAVQRLEKFQRRRDEDYK